MLYTRSFCDNCFVKILYSYSYHKHFISPKCTRHRWATHQRRTDPLEKLTVVGEKSEGKGRREGGGK